MYLPPTVCQALFGAAVQARLEAGRRGGAGWYSSRETQSLEGPVRCRWRPQTQGQEDGRPRLLWAEGVFVSFVGVICHGEHTPQQAGWPPDLGNSPCCPWCLPALCLRSRPGTDCPESSEDSAPWQPLSRRASFVATHCWGPGMGDTGRR